MSDRKCISVDDLKGKFCEKCSNDADCPTGEATSRPGDKGRCHILLGVCSVCQERIVSESQKYCVPLSTGTPKTAQQRCFSTTDCMNGCKCHEQFNQCFDERILKERNIACPTCASHMDCPNSYCTKSKKCYSCWFFPALDAMRPCLAKKKTVSNDFIPQESAPTKPACIATSWLRGRGLEHATIRHTGVAPVLCISRSSLPCATSGHLLRECTKGTRACKLKTYREVCQSREDCIESASAVSQLSHTFDWSQFKADGITERTTLELTSLSAHPYSGPSTPSRIFACIGNYLNSIGLGSLCNAAAKFTYRFGGLSKNDLAKASF